MRDYLYVDDVVAANEPALTKGSGETVNLGWGKPVSVNDIVRELQTILGGGPEAIHAEARPGEIQRIYLDASRAKRVLGWAPTVPFAEGLKRTVDWYQAAQAAR